jgi:hypothetical protein
MEKLGQKQQNKPKLNSQALAKRLQGKRILYRVQSVETIIHQVLSFVMAVDLLFLRLAPNVDSLTLVVQLYAGNVDQRFSATPSPF